MWSDKVYLPDAEKPFYLSPLYGKGKNVMVVESFPNCKLEPTAIMVNAYRTGVTAFFG